MLSTPISLRSCLSTSCPARAEAHGLIIHAGRMRDYLKWHEAYDDPASDLSWRLRQVQAYIRSALDQIEGPVVVLSLWAGDGRDVLQVLAERDDSSRVEVTLIELHPVLAQRAREFAAKAGLMNITVRTLDAGNTSAYAGSVPADLVIMIGVLGYQRRRRVPYHPCSASTMPTGRLSFVVASYRWRGPERFDPILADRNGLLRG